MPRKYPYYPAFDGKKASPLILKCVELTGKQFGLKNLGTYTNRLMRNSHTKNMKLGDPGSEQWLSTHATGFACDLGYAGLGKKHGLSDEQYARKIWDFFIFNSKELGLAEMHWYNYGRNKGLFGCGYRCSRGEGKLGVKIYKTDAESAGRGGAWFHIELCEQDPDEWAEKFLKLKMPD